MSEQVQHEPLSHQQEVAERLYDTMLSGIGGEEAKDTLVLALRIAYSSGANRGAEECSKKFQEPPKKMLLHVARERMLLDMAMERIRRAWNQKD